MSGNGWCTNCGTGYYATIPLKDGLCLTCSKLKARSTLTIGVRAKTWQSLMGDTPWVCANCGFNGAQHDLPWSGLCPQKEQKAFGPGYFCPDTRPGRDTMCVRCAKSVYEHVNWRCPGYRWDEKPKKRKVKKQTPKPQPKPLPSRFAGLMLDDEDTQ
jgi:hypothetical protein